MRVKQIPRRSLLQRIKIVRHVATAGGGAVATLSDLDRRNSGLMVSVAIWPANAEMIPNPDAF